MAQNDRIESLLGRTVRWTFDDGPTAGTAYEHVFNEDGSIGYRGAAAAATGKFSRAKAGTVVKAGDGLFIVSYLSDGGFTLTVLLNVRTGVAIGFASNNDSWFQQKGTFELIG
jgi:phenolic acid decarboxylase